MTDQNRIDNNLKLILIISGIAALTAGIIFRRNLFAEYFLLRSHGIISSGPMESPLYIKDWFLLIHNSKLFGLLLLNFFDYINFALVGLMFLGLYQILKNVNKSLMVLSMLFILAGIIIYFVSNQVFNIFALSGQYFRAINESDRSSLISAGQALLAIHNTNVTYSYGIYFPYGFATFGGILCSIVMLNSNIFSKITAIIGLIGTTLGMCFYVTAFLVPSLNVIPVAGSAPFLMVWYILVGVKMIKLSIEI